ncbi:SDR family NAD(P)-dependent oxidoreductase [Nocardioides sp. TF02-7]|nr:SDR family NAD(P)-dependent oxidoreductase [Nocardioides sp. TF02-7]UMG93959.1 SDR family NAD(P)-dependent oxidoreductase [Nocardioides sp. TF02-7]
MTNDEASNHPSSETRNQSSNDTRKVVLVTGASSGIGEATARRLAAEGHHVVLTARRIGRLETVVGELVAAGLSAEGRSLDVTDRTAFTALVDDVVGRHGRIDVLVGNAGVMLLSRLDALLVDEWDRMVDVNVRGLLHGVAAVLPPLPHPGQWARRHDRVCRRPRGGADVGGLLRDQVRRLGAHGGSPPGVRPGHQGHDDQSGRDRVGARRAHHRPARGRGDGRLPRRRDTRRRRRPRGRLRRLPAGGRRRQRGRGAAGRAALNRRSGHRRALSR